MRTEDRGAAGIVRTLVALLALLAAIPILSTCTARRPPVSQVALARQSITRLLQLPTYELVYRDVVYVDKNAPLSFMGIGGGEALFAVDVRICAGVTLETSLHIEASGPEAVVVYLPQAQVLSVDADESSVREYFVRSPLFGGTSQADYYDALEPLKGELVAEAVDSGLLIRAHENAKRLVEGLLRAAGLRRVVFRQKEPA